MFRSTFLAPSHYAGKWIIPDEEQRNDLAAVNDLGYAYATAPDSPAKEAKLLEVLECFHGYLMKYLCMIVRGTIPPANSRAGRDAKELLRTLAPRGVAPSKALTDATCKTLHLAFKGQTTEDIYDTLVFCFVKAARQYDPYYADKTRKVCEELYGIQKQFTVEQLEARVGFDCTGILRSLVRKGYLASVIGKKKVVGYKFGPKWPAPASFFESGPIGSVYVIQMWFRYYVKTHISEQLSELESNEGVLQLGDAPRVGSSNSGSHEGQFNDTLQANADGNCVNATGKFRFMADRTLLDMPLDVSSLNLDWVAETTDKLFKDLTVPQRTILYLYFHEEQSFKTIGKTFSTDAGICRRLVALTKEHEMWRCRQTDARRSIFSAFEVWQYAANEFDAIERWTMTLKDELAVIDETIAELEDRRTEIIHRLAASARATTAGNLLQFPNRPAVVVTSYGAPRHVW